jgi:brefeldin A-inhibited guanine nucleotide-exchange protein
VQVFSQAARDNESTIVRLSFDTVEKIVREHFTVITETDVGVFADCVNCLTAFANQSHDDSVALNAIAFLRFCAGRLAEGTIGDVDTLPEEVRPGQASPKLLEGPLPPVAILSGTNLLLGKGA